MKGADFKCIGSSPYTYPVQTLYPLKRKATTFVLSLENNHWVANIKLEDAKEFEKKFEKVENYSVHCPEQCVPVFLQFLKTKNAQHKYWGNIPLFLPALGKKYYALGICQTIMYLAEAISFFILECLKIDYEPFK